MRRLTIAALAALGTLASSAGAQDVAARVAAVRDGRVTLRFAARPGVCGDGRSFVRIGEHQFHGHWDGEVRTRACEPGPVRVEARVVGGRVSGLRAYVGPVPAPASGVTDLGAVAAPDAARWLLSIARTGEGESAKRAIMPAVLADSATVWRDLLAIARDSDDRPRGVRQDAAFWLSRLAAASAAGAPGQLDAGEHDERESDAVRAKKEAVFALSQLRGREGVPALVEIARTHREPSVRGSAMFWLGQSGDPRALALFEEVLSR